MADEQEDPPEGHGAHRRGYIAPSRRDLVPVTAHVEERVRRKLKMIALEKDTTLQRLLCISINNLLEENGSERLADEAERPRGGAAHKRR